MERIKVCINHGTDHGAKSCISHPVASECRNYQINFE